MSNLRIAAPLTFDSIVDGDGLRCVLWLQGCTHHCPHCHNPQTHALDQGQLISTDALFQAFINNPLQSGLTITGGEPFLQVAALLPLAKQIKQARKSIWLYTGFAIEALTSEAHLTYEDNMRLLAYCDVVVDGNYIEAKKDLSLRFRGSSNQRVIDMHQSIWRNQWILLD